MILTFKHIVYITDENIHLIVFIYVPEINNYGWIEWYVKDIEPSLGQNL